jgi:hypothetical protein
VKKPKPLPLTSPNWWSLDRTVQYVRAQVGSRDVADCGFLERVNQDLVHVKFEQIDRRTKPPTVAFGLLPPGKFYLEAHINNAWILRRRGDKRPVRSCALFFWEPSIKKFWPYREPAGNGREGENILRPSNPTTASLARDLKAPKKRGRRREHPWVKIRTETVRRIFNNGRPEWPKSENKLADEIGQWCLQQFKKEPANSELRAMIADVVERLRALLS